MAANVSILSWHGAAASKASTSLTDGQAIRFKQADNDTVDGLNPVPVPTSGTAYSFVKNFQYNLATPPSNAINNLRVYSDGGNGMGTGVDIVAKTSATYTDPITTGTTALAGASSVFGFTSGSSLAVNGSATNVTTGAIGDFIVMQATVGTTASQGTSGTETIFFSFDES